uniref:Ovule protein n=1 Tax=Romanomermis culicivorax TaxID=13658 RepID=A0A915K3Y7_ROMCU
MLPKMIKKSSNKRIIVWDNLVRNNGRWDRRNFSKKRRKCLFSTQNAMFSYKISFEQILGHSTAFNRENIENP